MYSYAFLNGIRFQLQIKIKPAYLFLFLDLLIGVLLYATARDFIRVLLEQQKAEEETYAADIGPLLLNISKVQHMPIAVLSFYLFNPWTILTCLAQSTEVFTNFFIALTLCCLLKKKYSCASLFIAASTYLSFYPLLMLSPLVLHTLLNSSSKIYDAVKSVLITMVCLCGLLWASYATYESWDFIGSVYGFILRAPDLTPNIGLFWYLFEEMFDHFKLFYLRVYQLNVFIYLIPVTIIFRKDPLLVAYTLLTLTAIFKSYSNLGSVLVPLALLPLWSYTFRYQRNVLLVSAFLLVTPILAPCMWHLWIYAGAGNANFFYAITLAYNTGHVFLLSDVLYAWLRYRYHLVNGVELTMPDGEPATPLLK